MPTSIDWDFIVRFLNITLIDLALSGDNAIVIGMAAASLPSSKRRFAIILGGAGAIGLRIALTSIATLLMRIPLLSAFGGLVLVWVAYKLLRLDVCEDDKECKTASNLRQALVLILTADFMMSVDNVIAVAGAAHGSVFLLIAGLLISMPLLMTTGGFISVLIDKFKWLVYVGAFAIVFTATRMVFEDRFIEARLQSPEFIVLPAAALVGIMVPSFFVWLNKRRAPKLATVKDVKQV
ncbi:MAG: Integral rane protein TerC [Dehalococcoidia bacterium]|nr:Integral rane protein TerC [Dehalococcoidia bacterium]